MSIMNKIKSALILTTAILLVSCTNSVDVPVNKETEITYGLSAILQLDSNIYSDSSVVSRTAMPTIPSTAVYYVDYKLESETEHFVKTDVFTTSGGRISGFYLPLSVGNWVIEVGVNDSGNKILKDTQTVTLTPEKPLMTNKVFFLKMSQTSGTGKGGMKLKITANTDASVSSIKVILEDGREIEKDAEDFFSAFDIQSGQQKILINAYNTASQLVYSTIQYINIYDNLVTNQWIIDGNKKDAYVITKGMTDDFKPRQYYVDGREESEGGIGNNENSGTSRDLPFKTIKHAIDVINARPEIYPFTIHVRDGSSETTTTTLEIKKSITIECWMNTPNDRLGNATIHANCQGECIVVGTTEDPVNLYLESLVKNNDSGLTLNGNETSCCGVKILNGIFVLNGGVIKGFGNIDNPHDVSGVMLPDNSDVQFIMSKGTIKENKANVAGGVYVGFNTLFQLEGGNIIDNIALAPGGYGVLNNGEMTLKGIVQISGNTNGGENANLYLPLVNTPNPTQLNKLNIYGSLTGSEIWISAPVGTEEGQLTPTAQKPVPITNNFMDLVAPKNIFKQDGTSAYVFMKSIDIATYGEVAYGLGGGIFYLPTDYTFTFESNVSSVTQGRDEVVTITPTVIRKEGGDMTSSLYYNPEDCLLYLNYSDSQYSNPAAGTETLSWTAELSLAGVVLPNDYQPRVATGSPANQFTIKGLPYKDTYTITITVNFMGLEYIASFPIVCN